MTALEENNATVMETPTNSSFPVASSTTHRSAPRDMASRHNRKEERKGLKASRSFQRRRPNANRVCSESAVKALEWERSKPARPKIDAEDLQSMSHVMSAMAVVGEVMAEGLRGDSRSIA
jgi:hypothetical protein